MKFQMIRYEDYKWKIKKSKSIRYHSPLSNCCYFLRYHGLGYADSSLRSGNGNLPVKVQKLFIFIVLCCSDFSKNDYFWRIKHTSSNITEESEQRNDILKTYGTKKSRKSYLSEVPDMKSPLSDIFILAPLTWKDRRYLIGLIWFELYDEIIVV